MTARRVGPLALRRRDEDLCLTRRALTSLLVGQGGIRSGFAAANAPRGGRAGGGRVRCGRRGGDRVYRCGGGGGRACNGRAAMLLFTK